MSEHVTQWLSAYQDGELRGGRLHHVETHLAGCLACQQDLEALQNLSGLLHEIPAPEFTSPERLAAQVNLRLPRNRSEPAANKVWEAGWWMIPVSLLSVWVLITAVGWIGDAVNAANRWGLLDTTSVGTIQVGAVRVKMLPPWLTPDSSPAEWAFVLEGMGILQGNSLVQAEIVESIARNVLPQFVWQVSIAVLYLGWLAIWLARHTQEEPAQLLEAAVPQSKM